MRCGPPAQRSYSFRLWKALQDESPFRPREFQTESASESEVRPRTQAIRGRLIRNLFGIHSARIITGRRIGHTHKMAERECFVIADVPSLVLNLVLVHFDLFTFSQTHVATSQSAAFTGCETVLKSGHLRCELESSSFACLVCLVSFA